MEITRVAAVGLFAALGVKTAGKWNKTRLEAKLGKIDSMVDDDTFFEADVEATLSDTLRAIRDKEKITVVEGGEDEAPAPAPKKAKDKGKGKAEPAQAPKKTKVEDEAPKAKTPKPKTKTKAKAKAKAGGNPPGVRAMRSRPYVAGEIIRERGLAAGVTDDMVEDLNKRYGKANDEMSRWILATAWHIIRGYEGEPNGS